MIIFFEKMRLWKNLNLYYIFIMENKIESIKYRECDNTNTKILYCMTGMLVAISFFIGYNIGVGLSIDRKIDMILEKLN